MPHLLVVVAVSEATIVDEARELGHVTLQACQAAAQAGRHGGTRRLMAADRPAGSRRRGGSSMVGD